MNSPILPLKPTRSSAVFGGASLCRCLMRGCGTWLYPTRLDWAPIVSLIGVLLDLRSCATMPNSSRRGWEIVFQQGRGQASAVDRLQRGQNILSEGRTEMHQDDVAPVDPVNRCLEVDLALVHGLRPVEGREQSAVVDRLQ